MRIHNSLTRKIEEFTQIKKPEVGIYICGPTVYDYAHIGHARTYVNSDVLVRALRWLEYEVKVVMNITDVGHLTSDQDTGEDKVEKKAREEKKKAFEITEFYTKDFWKMAEMLNITKPGVVCKATDHIKEMIELVKRLEMKGLTYRTSDGIYFDTSKLEDYGKLARLEKEGLEEGKRIEKNPEKRNATDFALWKFAKEGEKRQMEWDSPWGKHSFPGWHIECSAMSMKYLGEGFDIHTGGIDHVPVHHTNEIAQSEAATGKAFVKYWFHSGHLTLEGVKMSKSLNNFVRVVDVVEKGFEALALRYLYLTSHYRSSMNFTWEALEGAESALQRLREAVVEFKESKSRTSLSSEKLEKAQRFHKRFTEAVENDLAMPEAIGVVWEVVKSNIPGYDKYDLLMDFDEVLGLDLRKVERVERVVKVDKETQELIEEREVMRKKRKFNQADKIRQTIEAKGFIVEDTGKGAIIKKKKRIR